MYRAVRFIIQYKSNVKLGWWWVVAWSNIFRNHTWPFDGITRGVFRTTWSDNKFLQNYNVLANFLIAHSQPVWCVLSSVAENWLQPQCCSFGRNAYNFVAKNLSQYKMPTCKHCSLSVFSFDPCGHCFSIWLPSKVTFTLRLLHIRNNAPQCMRMFPDSVITA